MKWANERTEVMDYIASVTGKTIDDSGDNPRVTLTLRDADGDTGKWSTTKDIEKYEPLERNKTYKFRVATNLNERGKYPYRNLYDVLGEADLPTATSAPSEQSSSVSWQSGGSNPRFSPESQTAINQVIKLVELFPLVNRELTTLEQILTNIRDNLPDILDIAGDIEAHHIAALERRSPPQGSQVTNNEPATPGPTQPPNELPRQSMPSNGPANSASPTNPQNMGDVMNILQGEFPDRVKQGKFKQQVESVLGRDVSLVADHMEALAQVRATWNPEGPPDGI